MRRLRPAVSRRSASARASATFAHGGALPFSTTRKDDVVGDDLRRVALLAVLLVARRLEAPLNHHEVPLLEELAQRLGAATPDSDAVPLGPVLADVVLVEVRLVGREAELEDGPTAGGHPQLWVRAQIAEQHHTVQTFGHVSRLLRPRGLCRKEDELGSQFGERAIAPAALRFYPSIGRPLCRVAGSFAFPLFCPGSQVSGHRGFQDSPLGTRSGSCGSWLRLQPDPGPLGKTSEEAKVESERRSRLPTTEGRSR